MKKFAYLIAVTLILGLSACSSSDDAIEENEPKIDTESATLNLAPSKASKIKMFSNGMELSDCEDEIVSCEKVSTTSIDRDAEATLVKGILPEQNGNIDKLTTDFLYYAKDADVELEFYPVYALSSKVHNLGVFYYDKDGVKHEMIVWSDMNPYSDFYSTSWNYSQEKGSYAVNTSNGIKITVKKGYKFGFYWSGTRNYGDEGYANGYDVTYYSNKDLNIPVYCTNGGGTRITPETLSKIHAGTFNYGGCTYLGMEDWTDFDYQDLVLKCTSIVETVPASETKPVVDTTPSTPSTDPETPAEDPTEPTVSALGGSVEVNLALNAEHEKDDWKESHLSIHVRDTTDVTVFMPVPENYYCQADDMIISAKHDTEYKYHEAEEQFSMLVGDQTVSLTITYSEDGITVKTKGVNAEVLKYCREKYNDGITFDIRNYYNDDASRETLQQLLNGSTVTFENSTKVYVNSLGYSDDEEHSSVDPLACTVNPTDASNRDKSDLTKSEIEYAWLYIFTRNN